MRFSVCHNETVQDEIDVAMATIAIEIKNSEFAGANSHTNITRNKEPIEYKPDEM